MSVTRDEAVGVLTVTRPRALNALNSEANANLSLLAIASLE